MARKPPDYDAVIAALTANLFVGVPAVAVVTGLDERTVRRMIERGEIPCQRAGSKLLVPTKWVRGAALLDA